MVTKGLVSEPRHWCYPVERIVSMEQQKSNQRSIGTRYEREYITYNHAIALRWGGVRSRSLRWYRQWGIIASGTAIGFAQWREIRWRSRGLNGGGRGEGAVWGRIKSGRRLPRRHFTVRLRLIGFRLIWLGGTKTRSGAATKLRKERHDERNLVTANRNRDRMCMSGDEQGKKASTSQRRVVFLPPELLRLSSPEQETGRRKREQVIGEEETRERTVLRYSG